MANDKEHAVAGMVRSAKTVMDEEDQNAEARKRRKKEKKEKRRARREREMSETPIAAAPAALPPAVIATAAAAGRNGINDGGNATISRLASAATANTTVKPKPKSRQGGGGRKKDSSAAAAAAATGPAIGSITTSATTSPGSSSGGRHYTVSVAIPGSIIANAQSPALRTYLAGQVARALTVFGVDEIVIFREDTTGRKGTQGVGRGRRDSGPDDPCLFLARLLQYCDCPQYLRRRFFPMHRDLRDAGVLNPLMAPHHMGRDVVATYREAVTLDKPSRSGTGCLADCGLWKDVELNRALQPNIRVTVRLEDPIQQRNPKVKRLKGTAVAPSEPREKAGLYWGYTVRVADSLSQVLTQAPHAGGYDLTLGTSERGMPVEEYNVPNFKHLLIVFGGLHGLEASVEGEQSLGVDDPRHLFDAYLNTCANQCSGTIRTEEALLVTLSALRPSIRTAGTAGSS
eukprot:UC1_evm6s1194